MLTSNLLSRAVHLNRRHQLFLFLLLAACLLPALSAQAETSPLCNELGRYACARGTHDDVSGSVKSDEDAGRQLIDFANRTKNETAQEFRQILDNPDNGYFKQMSLAALGMKNSPQCSATDEASKQACLTTLSNGLASLVQRQALGSFGPSALSNRVGNMEDESYLITDANYTHVLEDVLKKAKKELGNQDLENKIRNSYFPEIKSLIVERISKMNIDEKQKKFMIQKIRGIQFKGFDCADTSSQQGPASAADRISSLIEPNAFYQPSSNTFKFCSAFLLQSTSEFSIATIIAHELSHSVDPCSLDYGPADSEFHYIDRSSLSAMEKAYPLPNLLSCLRDARSVGAKHLPAPPPDSRDSSAQYSSGFGAPQASPPSADKSFCDNSYRGGENDQITESFADWMAYEALPDFISKHHQLTPVQAREGYANVNRLTCWASGLSDRDGSSDTHPSMANRINHLLLANPKIREQMGCPIQPSNGLYCDGETAPASNSVNEQIRTTAPNESNLSPADRYRKGVR